MAVGRSAVRDLGIPVWVGGGLPKTIELARELEVAVNLWGAEPLRVAELTAAGTEVTWGGPVASIGDGGRGPAR